MSAKERIKTFLRQHVGEIVTASDLQKAAGNVTEWARRVREIRSDEGWEILSHNDDSSLKPGEYRLAKEPPLAGAYKFYKPISARLRAQVLDRNGYTCQMCGAGAGDQDLATGRTVRLHVGHIVDRSIGGKDTPTNLKALCSTCNQGAKNLVAEPPSWAWLMGRIRVASESEQRKALEWLQRKFNE